MQEITASPTIKITGILIVRPFRQNPIICDKYI